MIPDFNFSPFEDIHQKVLAGERLGFEDGLRLYRSHDLPVLGALAQIVRHRLNGRRVFYSVNLHLNYTNICSSRCLFCAFSKRPGEPGGYVYTPEEVREKVREAIRTWDINEVHVVGGHHPDLDFDYYRDMLGKIRELSASLYIKALTAPEIDHIATRTGIPVKEALVRLKEAGLDGLPGGGAEIFAPEIREKICRDKISADRWLEIHRLAHEVGLQSNATMLYGHIESDEDRVGHVIRIRELQDQTGGFNSFIPLAYHADNNPMEKIGQTGGFLDLKVYAVSRLLLDNVRHLKVHWVATGLKMGQVALSFGADDFGGTNFCEKIVHDAGSPTPSDLSRGNLENLILSAGYEPCLVDSSYQFC